MWDVPDFPWEIRNKILRICCNKIGVDLSAAEALIGADDDRTPTDNRENALNDEAVEVAKNMMYDNDMNAREDDYEDIAD